MNSPGITVSVDELVRLQGPARNLGLGTRGPALSSQAGGYASSFRGRGMEFDELRVYQPGDDIRTIDWRVTARTGQTHTKLFREERERPVLLVVDQSASMAFATRVAFKSVIAAKAAALIAWAAAENGDRIGAFIFSDEHHTEVRPVRGTRGVLHVLKTLTHQHELRTTTPAPENNISPWVNALARVNRIARPGTLVFIFSDFHNPSAEAKQHLTLLNRHNDVVHIFIYDPLERHLPPPGHYTITDGSQFSVVNTAAADIQTRYEARFTEHLNYQKTLCNSLGIHFIELATDQPITETLRCGLALRKQRRHSTIRRRKA